MSNAKITYPSSKNLLQLIEKLNEYKISNLHVSAVLNNCSQARKCIKYDNLDVDIKDIGGNSPLHYAARYNNIGMINWLCKHGANVHIQNNHGQTPLHFAYQACALRAVKALQKHGASTKAQDINGIIPAAMKRLRTKGNAPVPLLAGLEEPINAYELLPNPQCFKKILLSQL